jgi:hypothetical protein
LERKHRELAQKFRRGKLSDAHEHVPFPNLYAKEEALNLPMDDLKIMESEADIKDSIQVDDDYDGPNDEPLYATVDYRRKKRSMSLTDDSLLTNWLSLKEDAMDGMDDLAKTWAQPTTSTPAPSQPVSPPRSIL